MVEFYRYIKDKLFGAGSQRSAAIKRNIVSSVVLRIVGIAISLQLVPMTIHYVNPTRYGLWLTLSSIVVWLSYFDMGFGHGYRNCFAEAVARNDVNLAKQLTSTTYAVLTLLFSFLLVVTLVVNNFVDWCALLNIDQSYSDELRLVFALLAFFFCVNVVVSVIGTMLTAYQQPALDSLFKTLGNFFAFITIWFLTLQGDGSLAKLCLALAGVPCLTLILVSVVIFRMKRYRCFAPSFRCIRFSLSRRIVGLGGQFFVIMVSMLVIFQLINVILTRELGPEAVTQFNIANKLFNVVQMAAVIVLTPFWSAFTDAYVKGDRNWMEGVAVRLERLFLLCVPVLAAMWLAAPWFYRIWIGDAVSVPHSLSMCMAIYVFAQTGGMLYMYLINGTSKVRLQMIIYIVTAVVAVPSMVFCCRHYGLNGILVVPTIVYGSQMALGRLQLRRLIRGTATGVWNK